MLASAARGVVRRFRTTSNARFGPLASPRAASVRASPDSFSRIQAGNHADKRQFGLRINLILDEVPRLADSRIRKIVTVDQDPKEVGRLPAEGDPVLDGLAPVAKPPLGLREIREQHRCFPVRWRPQYRPFQQAPVEALSIRPTRVASRASGIERNRLERPAGLAPEWGQKRPATLPEQTRSGRNPLALQPIYPLRPFVRSARTRSLQHTDQHRGGRLVAVAGNERYESFAGSSTLAGVSAPERLQQSIGGHGNFAVREQIELPSRR